VASLSQGRTAAVQCGLFTHKSVPVIFEPPCTNLFFHKSLSSYCFKNCSSNGKKNFVLNNLHKNLLRLFYSSKYLARRLVETLQNADCVVFKETCLHLHFMWVVVEKL